VSLDKLCLKQILFIEGNFSFITNLCNKIAFSIEKIICLYFGIEEVVSIVIIKQMYETGS
jgi:hypothetical protein